MSFITDTLNNAIPDAPTRNRVLLYLALGVVAAAILFVWIYRTPPVAVDTYERQIQAQAETIKEQEAANAAATRRAEVAEQDALAAHAERTAIVHSTEVRHVQQSARRAARRRILDSDLAREYLRSLDASRGEPGDVADPTPTASRGAGGTDPSAAPNQE